MPLALLGLQRHAGVAMLYCNSDKTQKTTCNHTYTTQSTAIPNATLILPQPTLLNAITPTVSSSYSALTLPPSPPLPVRPDTKVVIHQTTFVGYTRPGTFCDIIWGLLLIVKKTACLHVQKMRSQPLVSSAFKSPSSCTKCERTSERG